MSPTLELLETGFWHLPHFLLTVVVVCAFVWLGKTAVNNRRNVRMVAEYFMVRSWVLKLLTKNVVLYFECVATMETFKMAYNGRACCRAGIRSCFSRNVSPISEPKAEDKY